MTVAPQNPPRATNNRDVAGATGRANPLAGLLVLLGALMALAPALLPWGSGRLGADSNPIGIVGASDIMRTVMAGELAPSADAWRLPVFAVTIIIGAIFGLLGLLLSARFFTRLPGHTRVAVSATLNALALGAVGYFCGFATDWALISEGHPLAWSLLLSGVATLIAAIVGYRR